VGFDARVVQRKGNRVARVAAKICGSGVGAVCLLFGFGVCYCLLFVFVAIRSILCASFSLCRIVGLRPYISMCVVLHTEEIEKQKNLKVKTRINLLAVNNGVKGFSY
jgi:hypothetical protein